MKAAMKPTAEYRKVRIDHYEVTRNGRRIGCLSQAPAWRLKGAGLWTYYPEGEAPPPPFRTLEEAQEHIN